jgi:hypothetical protein
MGGRSDSIEKKLRSLQKARLRMIISTVKERRTIYLITLFSTIKSDRQCSLGVKLGLVEERDAHSALVGLASLSCGHVASALRFTPYSPQRRGLWELGIKVEGFQL